MDLPTANTVLIAHKRCSKLPPLDITGAPRSHSPSPLLPRKPCTCSYGPFLTFLYVSPKKTQMGHESVVQRSAPRCWMHHEPGSGPNCSFRTCTTPRKRLCGAFFSCKPCFHLHTFAVEHSTPTFWMYQKRLWKRLLWCTGP